VSQRASADFTIDNLVITDRMNAPETEPETKPSANPETGDGSMLPAVLMVLSLTAIIALPVSRRFVK